MKVVVVGGRARSLVRQRGPLLRALVARGHEVVGVAPDTDVQGLEALQALGVRFAGVPMARHGTNPLQDLALLRAFEALYRRERPDLVLHTTIKPIVYGTLGAALAGVPRRTALVTGLGEAFAPGRSLKQRTVNGVARALYTAAAAACQRMIFQNADDALWFVELGILPDLDRVSVVHGSGVDMRHFVRAPLPEGPPVFLWMGRLLRNKGLLELIEAWRGLRARAGGAQLQVLGLFDPSHPAALTEAEVRAWHDAGDIQFLGGADDVRPALAGASVIVHPSQREGTPRAVLEAMAMGRAVITTDVPGCRQTIEHGREGYVVPFGEVAPLRAALARFVDEPGRVVSMGEAAWQRCRVRYDGDLVAQSTLTAMGVA